MSPHLAKDRADNRKALRLMLRALRPRLHAAR
jgi:hypothetical protein